MFATRMCVCVCVPVSRTGGQERTSTAAEASLDLSSLKMSCVVITHTDRLTCSESIHIILAPDVHHLGLESLLNVTTYVTRAASLFFIY